MAFHDFLSPMILVRMFMDQGCEVDAASRSSVTSVASGTARVPAAAHIAASLARVGAYGVTRSRIPASAGVRLALRWLQPAHAATVLSQLDPPPRLCGSTWSTVVPCRPQ